MATRKVIDWEAVEIQYRAGIRSLKDVGAEFGVSDAGILKRAKRDGWTRDLRAKIQAKADAKVSASLVSGEVSAQTKLAEAQVIEAEATVQARIRLGHRTDIGRSRKLALDLLAELEAETGSVDLFQQLGEMLRSEDKNGQDRRNDLYHKVISNAGRVDSMKKLADTLKVLIGLEREAYNINIDQGDGADKAPSGLAHFYGESE
ncbi:MAG: phage protein [Herbaspirillum sp.]|nr:phage protein [Herbaspirillum sp.]